MWTLEKVPGIWGGDIRGTLLRIWNLRGFIDREGKGHGWDAFGCRKPRRRRRSLAWAKDVILEDLVRRTRNRSSCLSDQALLGD